MAYVSKVYVESCDNRIIHKAGYVVGIGKQAHLNVDENSFIITRYFL